MNKRALIDVVLVGMLVCGWSCSGPKISVEEENVLAALSNIQQGLESNMSYDEFIQLLNQAKIEIDRLKNDPKYIENIARKELGMIGEDEVILKTPSQPEPKK